MGLYLDNGYVNIRYCMKFDCPFTFIIGGRGTGKTFGSQLVCIEDGYKYMLMRRTQAQTDLISKKEFSPVNPVTDHLGLVSEIRTATKYNGIIYTKPDPESEDLTLIGYTAALSTFSNLRGFDGSSVDVLIFDEFIPELHERMIKHESDAFFNVYETINRNRELKGSDPLRVLCLSNSNSLSSPVLSGLGLVKILERMQNKHQSEYINKDRGIAIFLLYNSPISDQKRKTALYRATADTDFSEMALDNTFSYDDMNDVKSISLNSGWKLFARLGDLFIYQKNGYWYLSRHGSGKPGREYDLSEIGTRKFIHDYPGSFQRIINRKIIYEDFSIKTVFTSIFI